MDRNTLVEKLKVAEIKEKRSTILSLCSGKSVLDVGCIGQDFTSDGADWLHDSIKETAGSLVGVDINKDMISEFNNKGYNMVHTSELDRRNEKFDIIVMADVIEHVDNPVEFLKFYSGFLNPGGNIVITTPNANRAVNFLSILFYNNYSVNDEHTCWFCPKTLYEVVTRAGLKYNDFYWLKKYYNTKGKGLITQITTTLADILASWRKNYQHNFLVTVSK